MKVVAFNGSPKPKGNTSILLRAVLQELEAEGIGTELIHVGSHTLRGCRACGQCRIRQDRRCSFDGDPVNEWVGKMAAADGILIGSPTYFADLTPETKALIDRCGYVGRSNGDLFRRKVGAAVVAVRRAGAVHAFDSINHFFTISQMIVPGSSYWNLGIGVAPGDVERDEEGMATMQTLGRNMAWLLKKIAV
jgi:multimeric flavodoxin WrbA